MFTEFECVCKVCITDKYTDKYRAMHHFKCSMQDDGIHWYYLFIYLFLP